jgi:mannose-1-phosphate guanylyltransferase / mannose-6-phosphate isomerase
MVWWRMDDILNQLSGGLEVPLYPPPVSGLPTIRRPLNHRLIVPVLLAGGNGTRLWPLSQPDVPKQFLPLLGAATMLQETVLRVKADDGVGLFTAPLIVGHERHRAVIESQLEMAGIDEFTLLLEPHSRNTAPAIAAAACYAEQHYPGAHMLVLPSDHRITLKDEFEKAIRNALRAAAMGRLVLFGISPASPSSAYGYIKAGLSLGASDHAREVEAFIEKPLACLARKLVEQGGHFWNAGIFLLPVGDFLHELSIHAADIFHSVKSAFRKGRRSGNITALEPDAYASCHGISIDVALMERTRRTAFVMADFGWADVGSWGSLHDHAQKDEQGNTAIGPVLVKESTDSYVRSEGPVISVLGASGMVVVGTPEGVLVASRQHLAYIKDAVGEAGCLPRNAVSGNITVRPWGHYTVLDEGAGYKVKKLVVDPGGVLSLQKHNFRSEAWVVVSGRAHTVLGECERVLDPAQTLLIECGVAHRLENRQQEPLIVIETQLGTRLCEDDIIRFEDIYGRIQ